MPLFKIIIKKKNGDVVINKVFESFPSKKIAENWAKEIAKLNGAEVETVKQVQVR